MVVIMFNLLNCSYSLSLIVHSVFPSLTSLNIAERLWSEFGIARNSSEHELQVEPILLTSQCKINNNVVILNNDSIYIKVVPYYMPQHRVAYCSTKVGFA
jgi:hypothetical protein